mmetsp:Transcript_19738/g.46127  ORF Transcript_19738/g.46127 Transcript_19738/m.46127 type:complete len:1033 (+) Transcript_19738:188-3286(+)
MEEEQSLDNANVVEESDDEEANLSQKLSTSSKPESQAIMTADQSLRMNNDSELIDTPSISSVQLDRKEYLGMNESKHGADTTVNKSSPRSKSKSKASRKKKKKVARNDDSGSNVDLDESNSGLETTADFSTTSSKLKPKGSRKKKKKTNRNDDGDSVDVVSMSSARSGLTAKSKSSPRKNKKKKKITQDGGFPDAKHDSMHSDDGVEDDKSSMASSVKSKSKTKSRSKKKKSKTLNENRLNIPDIEETKSLNIGGSENVQMKRTMSLEPSQRTNVNDRNERSFDDDQTSDLIVKRSMSLDTSNAQFRTTSMTPAARFNSQRENGMNGNNWSGRGRVYDGRGRGSPVGGRGRGRGRGPQPGGWVPARPQRPPERMQHGERRNDGRSHSQERIAYNARGVPQERMPYGNTGASLERSPYANRSTSQERSHYGPRGVSQERSPYSSRGTSQERSPYSPRKTSQERSPYGSRSVSQDRSPYGNTRVANGRGFVPFPRGRRRMSFPPPTTQFENPKSPRGSPPLQSKASRGNAYRAPSRPKSILRNSSHHGTLHGSSHHRNDRSLATSSSHSSQYNRSNVSVKLGGASTHSYNPRMQLSSFRSEMDSSDVESDDDSSFAMEDNDRSFSMEDSNKMNNNKQVPKTVVRGYSRALSGLGINSSHHVHMMKSTGQSARSLLTIERSEFQNENRFIRFLRFIHFLAPHPNEDPIKKKIRIVTWTALVLDLVNALVAIATYGGTTTQCCGKSIMTTLSGKRNFDWEMTIWIVTSLYIVLIFLEVVPVMRDAFPFNLLNPFIGFLITFAVFFSDSITESAVMWSVEMLAVLCEVISYRLRVKRFTKRKERLKNTKKEIKKLRKIKRKVKDQYDKGGGRILTRTDSAQFVLDLNDSSSFAEDSSFFDDIETQYNSGDMHTVASRTAITNVSNIGTARETRLLRERRQLMRSQEEDELDLRYHFAGTCFNVGLVVLSLLMLVLISKNGGMCVKGMRLGNIFKNDQLEKCNQCDGKAICEVCIWEDVDRTTLSEDSFCYYPYGLGI